MTDLIKRLREAHKEVKELYVADSLYKEAADRIEEAEAKLTKAVERLKTMADYNKYVVAPFLAELEGGK